MTSDTLAPHGPQSQSPATGVGALLALAARRDRIRLSVWVSALTLMMVYAPNAVKLAYPDEASRVARVNLLKTPAGIMLGGPFFGDNQTDLGVMMANELMLTLIVAASILSILTVVRHTRAEEESGTSELVVSAVVARHARTLAALTLVGAVNAVLAVMMTVALTVTGFDLIDCAGMCLGITAVSMLFGAIAAVAVQLWRQARTATGAAMGVLAAAVLVRGVGDILDHSGSALSWLSPIAWAQQMRSFVELRWWPLAPLVAVTAGLIALSMLLESRREYDDGVLPSRGDRVNAPPVRGVVGLNLVLQRGQVIGWGTGLFVSGLAFGSMTKSLQDAAKSNELLARVLATQGYDGIYTTLTQFLAAAATGFVVAGVVRLSHDEQSGITEEVLAGSVSRWRWLLSNVGATLIGAAILMALAGLGNGIGAAVTMGDAGLVGRLTAAGIAHVPAMAVMAGIAAIAVAVRQQLIGWVAVTFVVLALYLGALLRLPRWLIDLSPVGRTTAPASVPWTAMVAMVVAALALTALAGLILRRRDATQ
ncbi:MAG: polyether ionophore transport system permease protein [Mycobacterium sp.]|nr:polyether ionophore transport system permease protein [Mycobacterium sp.]